MDREWPRLVERPLFHLPWNVWQDCKKIPLNLQDCLQSEFAAKQGSFFKSKCIELDGVMLPAALLISFWRRKPLERFYILILSETVWTLTLVCRSFCIWLLLLSNNEVGKKLFLLIDHSILSINEILALPARASQCQYENSGTPVPLNSNTVNEILALGIPISLILILALGSPSGQCHMAYTDTPAPLNSHTLNEILALGIPISLILILALGSPSGQCHMAYTDTPAPLILPRTMAQM